MMRKDKTAVLLAMFFGAGCAPGGGPNRLSRPAAVSPEPISLSQAQGWWRGARATLKRDVTFILDRKKGVLVGEMTVPLAKPVRGAPNKDFRILFLLKDTAQSRRALRDGIWSAGSSAIALGLKTEGRSGDTGDKKDLILALRVQEDGDLTVRLECVRWWTLSGANDCTAAGMLGRAEPYLRAYFFELGTARAAVRTPAAPETTAGPGVSVLAVSARPSEVAPGSAVELVVNYKVEGAPSEVEVRERRVVKFGDKTIADLPSTVTRPSGTFTSSQKLKVPAAAPPGIYRIRATVSAGPDSAEGSALFEVK